jgi:hypothetical protein
MGAVKNAFHDEICTNADLANEDAVAEHLEPWRQALAAFYRHDCLPAKALHIQSGGKFDYLDVRAIEGLKAAVAAMRDAA